MPANLAAGARPEWHNMFTCSLGKSAKNVESTTRQESHLHAPLLGRRAGFDHYSDNVSLSSFARVVPRINTIIIAPLSTQLGVEVRSQFLVDR